MHYKNGREAKNGDKVLLLPEYGAPVVGILYDAKAGNDHCNGKIAPCLPSDPIPDLKDCLHIDDVKAVQLDALGDIGEYKLALLRRNEIEDKAHELFTQPLNGQMFAHGPDQCNPLGLVIVLRAAIQLLLEGKSLTNPFILTDSEAKVNPPFHETTNQCNPLAERRWPGHNERD